MATIRKQTAAFTAKDPYGHSYRVVVVTDFDRSVIVGEPAQEREGLSDFVLANESHHLNLIESRHLNRLEQGRYQIAGTDVVVTSDDPMAP
jgi:hypothetical protein